MVKINEDMIESINKNFEEKLEDDQEFVINDLPTLKQTNIEEEKAVYENLREFLNQMCPKNENEKSAKSK